VGVWDHKKKKVTKENSPDGRKGGDIRMGAILDSCIRERSFYRLLLLGRRGKPKKKKGPNRKEAPVKGREVFSEEKNRESSI